VGAANRILYPFWHAFYPHSVAMSVVAMWLLCFFLVSGAMWCFFEFHMVLVSGWRLVAMWLLCVFTPDRVFAPYRNANHAGLGNIERSIRFAQTVHQ